MEHDVTTDRVFLHLGPNGALGADEHQRILYRAGNAVSFVHSTKLILARCIREKGIELSPEGRAALDALADDFSAWRANPTWRGTPLPPEAPPPVTVGPTRSWSPSGGRGHPAPVSEAAVDVAVVLRRGQPGGDPCEGAEPLTRDPMLVTGVRDSEPAQNAAFPFE
jgi:hypothetical protein